MTSLKQHFRHGTLHASEADLSLLSVLTTSFSPSLFQELNNVCEPIVTQPKPKVDSPKEENPLNEQGDYKTEDMGEDDKNSDMPQQNGECHPGDQNTVNMDLD